MDSQLAYLIKERTYTSNSGTVYIDLPSNEQISMIMIEAQATGNGTPDHDESILDIVTNVQVLLEGSKTAFSAKPEVASFWAWVTQGWQPPHDIHHAADQDVMRLPIFFGRKPFDPEYMLDTGPYANAQLQIEYSLDTTNYTTATFQLTVWFVRPIAKLSPRGFVRSRIVNTYEAGASAEVKEVDLPSGLPWLDVGFRVWDADEYFKTNVTDVDLNIDEGRMHLYDGRIEDLITLNRVWFPSIVGGPIVRGYHSDEDEAYDFLGWHKHLSIMPFMSVVPILGTNSWRGRHFDIAAISNAGATLSADQNMTFRGYGCLPYSCIMAGVFHDAPFDAPRHADARLTYDLGATALTLETFVREVVSGVL